ncbi:oxidoreductase domain-containing protein [Daldinia vernicosa]|uniref:oxidoreductase domain-containing protein n=1 Tax=Daldinia vernicosa TaxID=114800 RepID=UPI002007310B|nr:oxidoreductase domain-containing protein [Daldinia vernicosa]KAI0846021.1 oxidoreductase domain-containing protein [Daldinia vernicosa]
MASDNGQDGDIFNRAAPASISAHIVDFNDTEVKEYASYFVMTNKDILTPGECADLLKLVSPPNGAPWPAATVTTYDSYQILDLNSRFFILNDALDIAGQFPIIHNETWRVSQLRHELGFLKYGPAQCFRPHCDGQFVDEDGARSYLTAHLYLNGDEDVEWGATRFGVDFEHPREGKLDINPTAGSLVIFQQRDMYHEGVIVTKGTKYTMRTDVMYEKA